jgi:hypothetical protein
MFYSCPPFTVALLFYPGTIIMFQSTPSRSIFRPFSFHPRTKTTLQSTHAHSLLWPLCFSQLLKTHLRVCCVSTSQVIALLPPFSFSNPLMLPFTKHMHCDTSILPFYVHIQFDCCRQSVCISKLSHCNTSSFSTYL